MQVHVIVERDRANPTQAQSLSVDKSSLHTVRANLHKAESTVGDEQKLGSRRQNRNTDGPRYSHDLDL